MDHHRLADPSGAHQYYGSPDCRFANKWEKKIEIGSGLPLLIKVTRRVRGMPPRIFQAYSVQNVIGRDRLHKITLSHTSTRVNGLTLVDVWNISRLFSIFCATKIVQRGARLGL